MDIKLNDILEFDIGKIQVRILVTNVTEIDMSGETMQDLPWASKGKFLSFSKNTFDMMVADGMLKKIGHQAKGTSYNI